MTKRKIIEQSGVIAGEIEAAKTPRPLRYAALRQTKPELTKQEAAIQAGFSPRTPTSTIEKTDIYKLAALTIDQQRQELAKDPAMGYAGTAIMVHDIASDQQVDPTARISAARLYVGMQGYEAPKQMEVRQTGLFLELSGLTGDDLRTIQGAFNGEQVQGTGNYSGKIEDAELVSEDISELCK